MVQSVTFEQSETGNLPPQEPPQPDPNRPAWLDPKFTKPEDLAASYREQQAALTRAQQELARLKGQADEQPPISGVQSGKEDDDVADETPVDEQPNPDGQEAAAKKVADAAGVDLNPYQEEYNTSGDVSEDNRVKLAESLKGVLGENARNIVDEFIEARKVVHANDTKMFMDAAGGQEQYGVMTAWAAQNLPKEQVAAYNKQVESGDRHSVLFAIEGLRAKYEAANGRLPQRITGSGNPSPNAGAFRSAAEMTSAMKDPRYKTDEAYRQDVARRLSISNFQ
jgi:hypothetical protein